MNNADRLKIGSDVFSIRWDGKGCVKMGKAKFVGKSIGGQGAPKVKIVRGPPLVDPNLPQKPLHQGGAFDPKRIADRINLLNDGERFDDFAFLWHPTPYLAAYWFLNESFVTPKPEDADVKRTITAATACVELLRASGFIGTGETTTWREPERDTAEAARALWDGRNDTKGNEPDPDDEENGDEEDEDDEPNRRPGPWT